MGLLKLLGLSSKAGVDRDFGELFDSIESILEGRTDEEVKLVTGYAGLLGKIAYSDMETSNVELERIQEILAEEMSLDGQQIEMIVKLLDDQHVKLFSLEDYIYTRFINDVCEKAEKLGLLHALFRVAAADESVCAEEDAALWSVAKGLRLSHKEFVTVRAEFAQHLDVLKP